MEAPRATQGQWTIKLLPKAINKGQERNPYNFRGNQGHVGNVDHRLDIGGHKVETHRPRFIQVVTPEKVQMGRETMKMAPQGRFPGGREKYDEIDFQRRLLDFQIHLLDFLTQSLDMIR